MAKMISFGEAMIRFSPLEDRPTPLAPSAALNFLSTIGGDEMNVCVDLALLGVETEWISVLPTNQWGQLIKQSAEETATRVDRCLIVDNEEVGLFFVIPEMKTVEFQRRNSAFARQKPGSFAWPEIMADAGGSAGWMHATGITPAIGPGPLAMWREALDEAISQKLTISFDLNHRPQLGELAELWGWVKPYLPSFGIIVLSVGQIVGLAALEGYPGTLPGPLDGNDDSGWQAVMRFFHKKWAGPAVACCFKRRGGANIQRRWAVIINDSGTISSNTQPVWHAPKEETGGGSAWGAGLIYGLRAGPQWQDPRTADLQHAMRSADMLAALCQESVGDHSTVRKPEFDAANAAFPAGQEGFVGGLTAADIPKELRSPGAKL